MTKTKPNEGPSLPVTIQVSEKRIKDLLCCAFEGGVGYWACITDYVGREAFLSLVAPYVELPMVEGCAVIVQEHEEEHPRDLRLDRAAVERGLALMAQKYPRHFGNFMNENEDAETGDVFLQLCLLGEIVYV